MKKNFFRTAFLAVFALASTTVFGQVTMSLTDAKAEAGGTGEAIISLDFDAESAPVFSLGFYVYQDETAKITIEGVEAIEDAFNGTAAATCKFKESKKRYTFSITDTEGEVFNPGDLAKITVKAADDAAEGDYILRVEDIEASMKGLDPATPANMELKVTVGPTGIEAISLEQCNAPVYNLNGMLMNGNLQKGVYVQHGKKFIVK